MLPRIEFVWDLTRFSGDSGNMCQYTSSTLHTVKNFRISFADGSILPLTQFISSSIRLSRAAICQFYSMRCSCRNDEDTLYDDHWWISEFFRHDSLTQKTSRISSPVSLHDSWAIFLLPLCLECWTTGVRFPAGTVTGFFLISTASRRALGPTQPHIQWVPRGSCLEDVAVGTWSWPLTFI